MWKEFKDFAFKGNVLDLAVAFILGVAFAAVVNSLVKDIIMPPIGYLFGGIDFSALYINLSGGSYASLADAQKAGAATINYGLFINTIITFIIVAFVLFLIIRSFNRMQRPRVEEAPNSKECPYCLSTIPLKATRCPDCTSDLTTGARPQGVGVS